MKLLRAPGSTSQILQVFVQDSSVTTGAGLTGLAHDTASLTAYYHRDTDTTATVISLVDMTVGTFTSSGFKVVDGTNMPGVYQFCPPNAALVAGAKSVVFMLKGAASMSPVLIEVDLAGDVVLDATISAALTKLLAATYDSVSRSAGVLTLSTGATQTISASGRVTAGP